MLKEHLKDSLIRPIKEKIKTRATTNSKIRATGKM
jgi:hypothetical protein